MKIIDCEQGSVGWHQARLGVITASEADNLVTSTGKISIGKGMETYLYKKLAEKVLRWSPDMLNSFPVEQGKIIEQIALPWYAFANETTVKRVGFITTDDGRCGCSPDAMLPDGGGMEVKAPQAPNHIRYVLNGKVPDDYVTQVQFSLWVTKAKYWKFVSYTICSELPQLVVHVEPVPAMQDAITEAVFRFTDAFDKAMSRLQEIHPHAEEIARQAKASS